MRVQSANMSSDGRKSKEEGGFLVLKNGEGSVAM